LAPSDLPLDTAIARGLLQAPDNMQTRQLAGAALDDPAFGRCSRALLDAAMVNVAEHIEFTGLMERFEESVVLLGEAFNWRNIGYVPVNVWGSPTPTELKPQTIARIRSENELDLELYEFVTERFAATVRAAGSAFAFNLQALRRCSAMLQGAEEEEAPSLAIEKRAATMRARFQRAEERSARLAGRNKQRRAASGR